jgi:hypothetical protein
LSHSFSRNPERPRDRIQSQPKWVAGRPVYGNGRAVSCAQEKTGGTYDRSSCSDIGRARRRAARKTIVDATGDIFDGRIQMVFDPSFVPYAKAGKVRLVLIDAEVRLADLPDVPTAQEVGLDLKGFRDRAWFGLFGPKGLPAAVASRISGEVARIAATPDMKAKLLLVAQYAHHQSTADFARQVADDRTFFAALLKQLDIKLE